MNIVRRVPKNVLDADEIEALLAGTTSAVMAFVDRRGFPRMVPCWFVWFDDAFHTTSVADKFHVRAIQRNPRGSFCVEIEEVTTTMRSNRQVKGVGEFEILEAPEAMADIARRIREKYLGPAAPALPLADDRVGVRLAPQKLSAHGGDLILG